MIKSYDDSRSEATRKAVTLVNVIIRIVFTL